MRTVSAAGVAAALRALPGPAPRLVVSGNFASPTALLSIVEEELELARLFVLNPQAGWTCRTGLITESPFLGPGARQGGVVDYLPMRLSLVPRLFRQSRPPDAVLLHTSVPQGGRVSLGIEVNILPAAIEAARRRGALVVAQVNPQMPYLRGDGEIELADVDLALEVETPLPSPSPRPPDEVASAIGEIVASFVEDGCTLQAGIGQVPDAALSHLKDRRELGVWSEMVSDGVMELERAGGLGGEAALAASFLFGSPTFYDWAREHPRLEMRRTEVINDPSLISAQPAMISINTALEVDLFAQSNASFVRGSVYSGLGGQPDFVSGALHSPGGHAVIALRSWHDKSDSSNIVPLLASPVSSFQHSAIVTEHGPAAIFGHSEREQATAIIDRAADPRAREALREAAARMGLGR
jgi:acyl-CoA hydrolase